MTTRATARETTRATVGREESPHGRAPRSARSVAAGYRTFRRRCRLSNRQKTSCIFAESAATYFLPLTKWFRLLFSAGQILPPLHMPAEITARSKVDISRVARLFGHKFCRSAVADNTLTIKQKSTLPVSKTRQDKSLFRSLSCAYLPPVESGLCVVLLCSHLAIMDFRCTCATTIRHRFPLTPVIRST